MQGQASYRTSAFRKMPWLDQQNPLHRPRAGVRLRRFVNQTGQHRAACRGRGQHARRAPLVCRRLMIIAHGLKQGHTTMSSASVGGKRAGVHGRRASRACLPVVSTATSGVVHCACPPANPRPPSPPRLCFYPHEKWVESRYASHRVVRPLLSPLTPPSYGGV